MKVTAFIEGTTRDGRTDALFVGTTSAVTGDVVFDLSCLGSLSGMLRPRLRVKLEKECPACHREY